jgi:FHA domain-containing protein/integrin beta-like protein
MDSAPRGFEPSALPKNGIVRPAAALRLVGIAAFSLAIFTHVPRVEAAARLAVGNPSLEHFDADGGVQLDFGLTDQSGAPVANLRPDNIQVLEDGKPAKIVDFRGAGQGRPVDIVFVMDVTESMQPYIDAVKQNVISFAQDLAANNRDYRLGLVTFEDYVISKEPDCNCPYRTKMTSDVNEFTNWVGSLHAGGGGDIPEDQLDALAYASTFPFRPQAQGVIILVTDAPAHHAGDGSGHTQHDAAFWDHHPNRDADVTDLTGDKVAAMLKRNGLTLYAVVPPPFIAPEYAEIVDATHGRSYNIVTEEGRFPELVREIGHSIATEYSLTYRTPRPIEDGTERGVELKVSYGDEALSGHTSYQVRGVGGAAINVPEEGETAGANTEGSGLRQLSFSWWNLAVPLAAIMGLLALSQMRFGLSTEELKAVVEAQSRPAVSTPVTARPAGPAPARPRPVAPVTANRAAGVTRGARLVTIDPIDPVPSEYSLLKDEASLGRGEDNDIVIPHASVSRTHARLVRRGAAYELTDLNSTNGSFVNERPVHATTTVASGGELRLGDVRFVLHF